MAIANGTTPKGLEQSFAASLEISPSMWSQIKSSRPIGDKLARQIEQHCGKPVGWLDEERADAGWAKVYAELCASLDRRSVVQAHLFQHIDSEVDIETVWMDEQVWVRGWRGLEPLASSRAAMFVHPRTGILLVNRASIVDRH